MTLIIVEQFILCCHQMTASVCELEKRNIARSRREKEKKFIHEVLELTVTKFELIKRERVRSCPQ